MAWKSDPFALEGGVNQVDSHRKLKPGFLAFAENYECVIGGGYRRMDGYERFDGRPAPSSATYYTLSFVDGGSRQITVGDVVIGGTFGGAGIVLQTPTLDSGSWAGGDAAGTLVIGRTGGGFFPAEALIIGGVDSATVDSEAAVGVVTDARYSEWLRLAKANRRADITAIPGSGPVRGVWFYNGVVYAFRNNVGATACAMWKSTSGGWSQITYKKEIAFINGAGNPPLDGATITKGGASATLRRICLESGAWADSDAAGRFIVDTVVGGPFSAGAFTAGISADAVGAETQISMLPGGRFEFVNNNFFGATDRFRMYGVDGVNNGFEFDSTGDVFAPIRTGMVVDTPDHIEAHRDYLFFSFRGGSIQNSGVGNPFNWTVRLGAQEFGLGDDVTGMKSLRGSALAILGLNTAKVLYGTGAATWDLKPFMKKTGAMAYCLLEVAQQALAFDSSGGYFLEATQAIGDFKPTMLTRVVDKTVKAKGTLARAMLVCSDKGQVRIFFSDKTGLTATFSGTKLVGWMPFRLLNQVVCVCEGEDASNNKRMFAGTDDGYVMELNAGTSFDGPAIPSIARLVFNDQRMPGWKKRYHKLTLEVDVPRRVALRVVCEFDNGGGDQNSNQLATALATGGLWDFAAWDEFEWDSPIVGEIEASLDGVGKNIAIVLYHEDDIDPPFTLNHALLNYTLRGQVR